MNTNTCTPTLESTVGYDKIARDYDRGRPDYPDELLHFFSANLRLMPGITVLDLAAGTGKVTKALLPLDVDIVAVEPVAEMRAIYSQHFPDIPIHEGTAEEIPLPNNSVDIVFVGTAFHWFDGERALSEIHRILGPFGKLALLWNARAIEVPWVRAVWDVLERHEKGSSHDLTDWKVAFEKTNFFTSLNHYTYHYSFKGGAEEILDRLFSSKLMGKLSKEKKEQVVNEVLHVLDTHPDTQGRKLFDIPYRVEFYWCDVKK